MLDDFDTDEETEETTEEGKTEETRNCAGIGFSNYFTQIHKTCKSHVNDMQAVARVVWNFVYIKTVFWSLLGDLPFCDFLGNCQLNVLLNSKFSDKNNGCFMAKLRTQKIPTTD